MASADWLTFSNASTLSYKKLDEDKKFALSIRSKCLHFLLAHNSDFFLKSYSGVYYIKWDSADARFEVFSRMYFINKDIEDLSNCLSLEWCKMSEWVGWDSKKYRVSIAIG